MKCLICGYDLRENDGVIAVQAVYYNSRHGTTVGKSDAGGYVHLPCLLKGLGE